MTDDLKTACMNFYDSWFGAPIAPPEHLEKAEARNEAARKEFSQILYEFVRLWQTPCQLANADVALTSAPSVPDAIVDLIAENLWRKDYPNGGSIVKTWEDNQFHDKEWYRKEAKTMLATAPQITKPAENVTKETASNAGDSWFPIETAPKDGIVKKKAKR